MLYNSSISAVRFSFMSNQDIVNQSNVRVDSYELFRNNMPYENGLYDSRLGTTDYAYRCSTCWNRKTSCPGHFGHLTAQYPLFSPLAFEQCKRWLRLICFKCGLPIINYDVENIPRAQRLRVVSAAAKNTKTSKLCVHCNTKHFSIRKAKHDPLMILAEDIEEGKVVERFVLLPHKVYEILTKVPDEVVMELSPVNPRATSRINHPRDSVLFNIPIPPTTIRPDVKMGSVRGMNDKINAVLQVLVKQNQNFSSIITDDIDEKTQQAIMNFNHIYYDFIRAAKVDNKNQISIASRLTGKKGRFRLNLTGKRVRNICRSTIVGDPNLKIDEVGIPLIFARTVQVEETIQESTKRRLLTYIQNGRAKYPGATKIIKKNGVEYNVNNPNILLKIEPGDRVLRDLIDGDPVNFNRQPTLTISSISTHRAKIIMDPSVYTLQMNVLVCPLYNADFDGDQMNLIISTSEAARNEISRLSKVANWFISHTNSSPSMGQVDDSIVGLAELTRANVKFDKYHALMLLGKTSLIAKFHRRYGDMQPGEFISGRDIISLILEDAPVNYTRKTNWFSPNLAKYIEYDDDEKRVEIRRGKMISGVLDKSSIGKGAVNGLYHVIALEYGNDVVLEIMHQMQQVAIAYLYQFGFTIGIMDMLIPYEKKQEIHKKTMDMINKSNLISQELIAGEIVPPIGKTVEQFYEDKQINTLIVFDDFVEPVITSINPNANNLFKLMGFGSKGDLSKMLNMVSTIGQKLINGERIRQKFGYKRTLPYYQRFETAPEARGYITNSYLAGMNLQEYIFNAEAARFDLISKALSTSVTGEQNRKSIKNLESIITSNLRWSLKHRNVIQFAYGDDYLDPRKVENVLFPTAFISDAEFRARYFHADFPQFFQTMERDRAQYRQYFLKIEKMNIKELIDEKKWMPFNVERILESVKPDVTLPAETPARAKPAATNAARRNKRGAAESAASVLSRKVRRVEQFCDELPFVYSNEIQLAHYRRDPSSAPPPDQHRMAAWLPSMLIRSYLHPKALDAIDEKTLELALDKIWLKFQEALVDPGTAVGINAAQAISEPFTQYMLDAHQRSATGGTSKSSINKLREVFGSKQTHGGSMLIPVVDSTGRGTTDALSRAQVQEWSNHIEEIALERFVSSWHIYFEEYAEPIHPATEHEAKIIKKFNAMNPHSPPPGDLVHWCIRIVLDKSALILKNMTVDTIIRKLTGDFPDTYIVYTLETAPVTMLRVYMRATMFKSAVDLKVVRGIKNQLLATTIRGISGVTNAEVTKLFRNHIAEDGAVIRREQWAIRTEGINLYDILSLDFVDKPAIQCDSIHDIYDLYGIEAVRQKIIMEMRSLVDVCNSRHYMMYADEMTYTGKITTIALAGVAAREASNILLRIGFSAPVNTLRDAAAGNARDIISGVSAPMLLGSVPKHGTLYNQFYVDEEFIEREMPSGEDKLNTLFDD